MEEKKYQFGELTELHVHVGSAADPPIMWEIAQDQGIKLTPIEFEIINCLLQNHGQTVASGTLLKDVWGYSPDDDVETVRVHIRHLRAKLEKSIPDKKYIETVYGGGYRLVPDGVSKTDKG